jgi:2-amino-4-hydroxy-6-hydroxymethyldihydropteridine diphosphokinase
MKSTVIILIGGNLGDRSSNLKKATSEISETIGTIKTRSSLYETEAWGKTDQPKFLNQVLIVSTNLSPAQVLKYALETETKLGRVRAEKWGARLIDIDILYFDNQVINSGNLTVPHPGIAKRRFVLEPLVEVIPDFVHPVLNKTHRQLLAECKDILSVKQI